MTDEALHEGIELRQRIVGTLVLIGLSCLVLPLIFKHPVVRHTHAHGNTTTTASLPIKPVITMPPQPKDAEAADVQTPAPVKKTSPVAEPAHVKQAAKPKSMPQPAVTAKSTSKPKPAAKAKTIPKPVVVSGWMIQTGSFSQHDHANHLYAKLKKAGYKAHLQKKQVHHHQIWQVLVGPTKDQKAARKLQQQIDRKLKMKTILKRVHA